VNKAVAEMDKVVQQNAANAEENASASEEMNAQAEQMKGFVNELISMVGGGSRRATKLEYGAGSKEANSRGNGDSGSEKALMTPTRGKTGKAPVPRRGREVKPELVIPLKDEDFADF
jgi:methyl-accepting chemotaxis protein